jgi:hypothetical protein
MPPRRQHQTVIANANSRPSSDKQTKMKRPILTISILILTEGPEQKLQPWNLYFIFAEHSALKLKI